MNAAIVILANGVPCIACDAYLPHEIGYVGFNPDGHQLKFVYLPPSAGDFTFSFPLDERFIELLRERGTVAVAVVLDNDIKDLRVYPMVFTEN